MIRKTEENGNGQILEKNWNLRQILTSYLVKSCQYRSSLWYSIRPIPIYLQNSTKFYMHISTYVFILSKKIILNMYLDLKWKNGK